MKRVVAVKVEFRPGMLVRDDLRDLAPYKPAVFPEAIKLDANENPFDFPAEVKQAIWEMLGPQTFTRYPDAAAEALREELGRIHNLDREYILAGNGSDELILNLMLAFGAGNRVVIAVPTFSMYGIHARVAGAQAVEVPRAGGFELDVQRIVEKARDAGLVVLCSPNNPTGNSASTGQLREVLQNCPCPVVVDQAYVEFGGTDFSPLLAEYPNLVILRTFSKAYGLAGLRVGYLFAGPEVMYYLQRVKQPFNLNSFSQTAALAVLRYRDVFARQVAVIVEEREAMYRAMQKMPGVTVYPSEANYLLFTTGYPAREVFAGLLKEKVLVRSFSEPLLAEFLRVTVGRPQENKIFLHSLQKVIANLGEKHNG